MNQPSSLVCPQCGRSFGIKMVNSENRIAKCGGCFSSWCIDEPSESVTGRSLVSRQYAARRREEEAFAKYMEEQRRLDRSSLAASRVPRGRKS